jgi:hypothetical protein
MRVERPAEPTYKYSPATACQIFDATTASVKRIQLAPRAHVLCCKVVRTNILQDYIGIMIINHPGGKLIG